MSSPAILHKSIMIGSLAYDAEDGVILKCYTEETRQQFAAVIRPWRKLWQRHKSRWMDG
jgi:hypothetical protein